VPKEDKKALKGGSPGVGGQQMRLIARFTARSSRKNAPDLIRAGYSANQSQVRLSPPHQV